MSNKTLASRETIVFTKIREKEPTDVVYTDCIVKISIHKEKNDKGRITFHLLNGELHHVIYDTIKEAQEYLKRFDNGYSSSPPIDIINL